MPHPSASSEQRHAETLILAAVSEDLGVTLSPQRLYLPEGAAVDIDGVADDHTVLVEVYAHQGALRGSQPRKLASDALKLVTVRRAAETIAAKQAENLGTAGAEGALGGAARLCAARLVLALADEAAANGVRKGWLGEALTLWDVEVVVVGLPSEVTAGLQAAQVRQQMVNAGQADEDGIQAVPPEPGVA